MWIIAGLASVELVGRVGKQVVYGLYAITNFIWTIGLYVSNATGCWYLRLHFTTNSIGKNMQTLAGY